MKAIQHIHFKLEENETIYDSFIFVKTGRENDVRFDLMKIVSITDKVIYTHVGKTGVKLAVYRGFTAPVTGSHQQKFTAVYRKN